MDTPLSGTEPQHIVIAEMTPSEMKAQSGIEDMTNIEAIEWLEGIMHGARVYTSHQKLSEAGRAEVSRITRSKTGEELPLAVVSVRPPKSHA